jgi:hypothetical protein
MFEVKLNDEEMRKLASEAIFLAIDQESRDALVKQAIEYLLAPSKESYNRGRSPLQLAFQGAIEQVARKIVTEKLENDPEVGKQIEGLVADAWKRLLEFNRGTTVDKIAGVLAKAIGD